MRVAQICSFDNTGGAARAAYRIHRGVLGAGVDSTMLVGSKISDDPSVKLVPRNRNIFAKIRRRMRYGFTGREIRLHADSIAGGYDLFSSDRIPGAVTIPPGLLRVDLIHLHWISWFIDYEDFFLRSVPSVPIVWTLQDMNTLTGGCHYDAGCGRYTDRCGKCPALESNNPEDLSFQIFQRKAHVFARLNPPSLHFVATSHWQARVTQQSALLKRFPCTVIPNALNTTHFSPRDRAAARAALKIPQDKKVVLFVADSAVQKRKGFEYLAKALIDMRGRPDLFLISVGGGKPELPGVEHHHLGRISSDVALAEIYSAADVFVIPSLQENFGQTVIESFACGTPVVGFATGGITDTVRPGVTGYLAPVGNAEALRIEIERILDDPDTALAMGRNCRDIAVREYSLETQSAAYIKLYDSLLEKTK